MPRLAFQYKETVAGAGQFPTVFVAVLRGEVGLLGFGGVSCAVVVEAELAKCRKVDIRVEVFSGGFVEDELNGVVGIVAAPVADGVVALVAVEVLIVVCRGVAQLPVCLAVWIGVLFDVEGRSVGLVPRKVVAAAVVDAGTIQWVFRVVPEVHAVFVLQAHAARAVAGLFQLPDVGVVGKCFDGLAQVFVVYCVAAEFFRFLGESHVVPVSCQGHIVRSFHRFRKVDGTVAGVFCGTEVSLCGVAFGIVVEVCATLGSDLIACHGLHVVVPGRVER